MLRWRATHTGTAVGSSCVVGRPVSVSIYPHTLSHPSLLLVWFYPSHSPTRGYIHPDGTRRASPECLDQGRVFGMCCYRWPSRHGGRGGRCCTGLGTRPPFRPMGTPCPYTDTTRGSSNSSGNTRNAGSGWGSWQANVVLHTYTDDTVNQKPYCLQLSHVPT